MSGKITAKDAIITAITMDDVSDVALFLHHHMNSRFTPQVWLNGISKSWLSDTPNYSFMLKCNDKIVGVLCAYTQNNLWQTNRCDSVIPIAGMCCLIFECAVLIWYWRPYGKEFSFTMFSPNIEGIEILKYLKFKPLNNLMLIFFNTPSIGGAGQVETLQNMQQAEAHLPKEAAKCLMDHTEFLWLNLLFFNVNGKYGFLIYKKDIYKRLACSWIMYASDAV